jgi:long-chain fatty acid transport protein
MEMRGRFFWRTLGVLTLGALATGPSYAAGFGIFEQGAKAEGMAGAFTAQADDPSALFYNAGGLAFVQKGEFSVGVTWITTTKADFEGANPYPGNGYRAKQKGLSAFPPHAYYVGSLNQQWKWGIGVETPFGLTTEWEKPDSFAGRFLSTKASLRAFDINPTIAYQATPDFGIGVGVIGRISDVELNRQVGATNPFTLAQTSIAKVKLNGDFNEGYGWNIGLLDKVTSYFSIGLSYRSPITVDYTGDARFTQVLTGNTQFDNVVAGQLPFNRNLPVKTSIDYPDLASLGLAFTLTPELVVEVDVNRTGWSRFDELKIDFTGAGTDAFDSVIAEKWKSVFNYRAGVRWSSSAVSQWRFGLLYDKTPQPEQTVNPLLPDADRTGISLGYGYTGHSCKADIALTYLDFKDRTRAKSFAGDGPFFGTYSTRALLLGATLSFP